jgi:hypothetical protein
MCMEFEGHWRLHLKTPVRYSLSDLVPRAHIVCHNHSALRVKHGLSFFVRSSQHRRRFRSSFCITLPYSRSKMLRSRLACATLPADSRAQFQLGPSCWRHIQTRVCFLSVWGPRFATLLPRSLRARTGHDLPSSPHPTVARKRPSHRRWGSGWPPFRLFEVTMSSPFGASPIIPMAIVTSGLRRSRR